MNIQLALKRADRIEESYESEILLGLSLVNARRYLQAAEIFRKVSEYFSNKSTKDSRNKNGDLTDLIKELDNCQNKNNYQEDSETNKV